MDVNAILEKTGQKLTEREANAFKSISVKEKIKFLLFFPIYHHFFFKKSKKKNLTFF